MAQNPPQPGIEPATKAATPPPLYLLQIMSVIQRSPALDNGLHTDGGIAWIRLFDISQEYKIVWKREVKKRFVT